MAQDPSKASGGTSGDKGPAKGGNTPKPGGNTPKPSSMTAKDRSRQQSRPVSGKAPAGKAGTAPKTAGPAAGAKKAGGKNLAAKPPSNRGLLMAWGAVGIVVIVIATFVIINATSSTATAGQVPVTPAPSQVVDQVTNIPLSVYNQVGTGGSAVTAPTVISGQPAMTLNGQTPAMLYIGAEYCPYCAAERWAVVAALSRFGTWKGLQVTASNSADVFPSTQTFSFRTASLTSSYIGFNAVEEYTNVATSTGHVPLQKPTAAENVIIAKYSSPTYLPGVQAGTVSYPFIDLNNLGLISGASYSPGLLAGQTHEDIAGSLNDATNPITQAIVGTANYISALVCASSKQQPSNVCTSTGVQAAAKAMKLS